MQQSKKQVSDFHDVRETEDWTDDEGEVRELTRKDFARMTPFAELPEDLKGFLLQVKDATIRPDLLSSETVTLQLSRPVLERFRAEGTGWESRVDEALRQWMEEHQAS